MAAINDLIRKVGIIPVPKNKKKLPINTPSMALDEMLLREHMKEYGLSKLKRKRKGSEGYSPQGEQDYDPDFRMFDLDRRMKITPEALELRRRPMYRSFDI